VADRDADRSYGKSARFYDLFDRKENVELFSHYAVPTGEVLDIGAGTGRIAIPLAERGVRLVCVEPSQAMRREFECKLAGRPDLAGQIRLVAGDARSFRVDGVFGCALLSGTFDHFLDAEERLESLLNINSHLTNGGILVFDLFLGLMRDAPLSPAGKVNVGEREIRRFAGAKVLPGGKQEVILVYEVCRGGEVVDRIEERGLVGVTSRESVEQLLGQTGFEIRHEWGDYRFKPYRDGDPLLIVEAVKRDQLPG
jgi:SAM-dependent methyltransferase